MLWKGWVLQMKKNKLKELTDNAFNATHNALQTVFNALNKGQKIQLIKHQEVAELLARYNVNTEGAK